MTTLSELLARRDSLAEALRMMTEARRDMIHARDDAAFYTGMAAAWAAVLLTADVIRIGLSAADSRAAAGFAGMDRAVNGANKLLVAFKRSPIARKEDALASLDPDLRKVSTMADSVKRVCEWLLRMAGPGSKEAGEQAKLVLNLATTMTQDTLLMLQAGKDQSRLSSLNVDAINRASNQIERIRQALHRVNDQIQLWLFRAERYIG